MTRWWFLGVLSLVCADVATSAFAQSTEMHLPDTYDEDERTWQRNREAFNLFTNCTRPSVAVWVLGLDALPKSMAQRLTDSVVRDVVWERIFARIPARKIDPLEIPVLHQQILDGKQIDEPSPGFDLKLNVGVSFLEDKFSVVVSFQKRLNDPLSGYSHRVSTWENTIVSRPHHRDRGVVLSRLRVEIDGFLGEFNERNKEACQSRVPAESTT